MLAKTIPELIDPMLNIEFDPINSRLVTCFDVILIVAVDLPFVRFRLLVNRQRRLENPASQLLLLYAENWRLWRAFTALNFFMVLLDIEHFRFRASLESVSLSGEYGYLWGSWAGGNYGNFWIYLIRTLGVFVTKHANLLLVHYFE